MTVANHLNDRGAWILELRMIGVVASMHWLSWMCALAWTLFTTRQLETLVIAPHVSLLLPHAVATVVTVLFLAAELPLIRWPVRHTSPIVDVVLGFPAWPVALALWAQRSRADVKRRAESTHALQKLRCLPKIATRRFVLWAVGALGVDAIILARHAGWSRGDTLAITALWVSMVGPLATLLYARLRGLVRVACETAPPPASTSVKRSNVRSFLGLSTSMVSLTLIVIPFLSVYLWQSRPHNDADDATGQVSPEQRSFGPAFLLSGFAIVCAALGAATCLAHDIHRDIWRAIGQARSFSSNAAAHPISPSRRKFTTFELDQLAQAVDQLFGRTSDANVAKYVAIERAKEVDRLKSQFLANMSHDLRSPLNSILGFSELLLSGIDGELSAEQRELVAPIHESGRALLREIDDILDTAKIEAGRLDLVPEPTPVATMVTRSIRAARKTQANDVTYAVKIAPGLPPIMVDPHQTVHAMRNVLLFAGERLEAGEIAICASPEEGAQGRAVFVEIQTPVPPASSEQLARARRGFYRIPGHRGLGLALPIASSILELQGGRLQIEERGRGMVFTLEFHVPHARRREPALGSRPAASSTP